MSPRAHMLTVMPSVQALIMPLLSEVSMSQFMNVYTYIRTNYYIYYKLLFSIGLV